LHVLITLSVYTSCRRMMGLTWGALKMCVCALGTCVPSCISRSAMLFFMLERCDPQGAVGHVAAPEPTPTGRRGPKTQDTWQHQSPPQPGGEVRSYSTHGSTRTHLSREARSGAIGHVVVPEPTSAVRRGPEPYDTWQRRSPPQSISEVRSYRARGSTGVHHSW
jgi:hypothetical protein